MAIIIEDVKYTPNPMIAGSKVKATVKVTADDGVASVKLYTPDYRTLEARHEGDGIFAVEADVPYDADAGYYDLTLVATDKEGNTNRKTIQIRIG